MAGDRHPLKDFRRCAWFWKRPGVEATKTRRRAKAGTITAEPQPPEEASRQVFRDARSTRGTYQAANGWMNDCPTRGQPEVAKNSLPDFKRGIRSPGRGRESTKQKHHIWASLIRNEALKLLIRRKDNHAAMSDDDDWDFAGADDAKMTIRAAIRYLLKGAAGGGARGDIVEEIITIVRQVSAGPPLGQPDDPLDDDMPGG
jgi:hypothetical protein